jgi:Fe-S-cluster containining protein
MGQMNGKATLPDEIESKSVNALLKFSQGRFTEAEQLVLDLLTETKDDAERYSRYLFYGEILMKLGRLEDSRVALIHSAQIALNRKNDQWLALSHEQLGDLSAVEGDWFGALHQYRYSLRKASSLFERLLIEQLIVKVNAAQTTIHSTVLSQDTNILPLTKEYVSGNVAISFVQRNIFLKAYFARCLECNFCHDWCCSFGADVDILNVEKIQQRREEILPFVRPPEVEWFESEYTYYEEYAGNQYTRINPQGPRCVFISKDQRGCGLHRYAVSKQMDYHEIKPLVCILFPLSFSEGILSPAPELDDNSLICSGSGESVYQSLRNELEYYFGREFVEELDTMEKKVLRER